MGSSEIVYCRVISDFSEEIGRSKFNSMIGLVDRERVDAALYDDYETVKAREVCQLMCYQYYMLAQKFGGTFPFDQGTFL